MADWLLGNHPPGLQGRRLRCHRHQQPHMRQSLKILQWPQALVVIMAPLGKGQRLLLLAALLGKGQCRRLLTALLSKGHCSLLLGNLLLGSLLPGRLQRVLGQGQQGRQVTLLQHRLFRLEEAPHVLPKTRQHPRPQIRLAPAQLGPKVLERALAAKENQGKVYRLHPKVHGAHL